MRFDYSNTILLIPDKDDIERDAVAKAWKESGGEVLRIGRFWEPPTLENKIVKVYGNNMFCLILAEKLGFKLVSPDDDILRKFDEKWTKRKINIIKLADVGSLIFPLFIKSAVPKIFSAKVYRGLNELMEECRQLEDETLIITSEIVKIKAEARSFILDGAVKTISLYEGNEDISEAKKFVDDFLSKNKKLLPKSVVLDVGYIQDKGWAVIEANPAWGAGLNGCEAEKAIDCIANAVLS